MKILQQIKLKHLTIDNKFFIVTLYAVNNERFVVKYSYVLNDETLEEYNKTELPINKAQAELVFNNLLQYKLSKGYEYMQKEDINKSKFTYNPQAQTEAILNNLAAAVAGTYEGNWQLSRIIWRVGELMIQKAIPHLLRLSANDLDDQEKYALIWTLGRLADEAAIPFLERLHNAPPAALFVNITREALAQTYQGTERTEFIKKIMLGLPHDFEAVLATNDEQEIFNWLNDNCLQLQKTNDLLPVVYTISKEYSVLRQALISLVASLPMKPKHFKALRQVFKAAEFRKDGEMFGGLAYRFEKTTENYNSGSFWTNTETGYINTKAGQKNGEIAYSNKTRAYFKRRVWRTLRKLGEANDAAYVKMATSVLIPYNDLTENSEPYTSTNWLNNRAIKRFQKHTKTVDSQAEYLTFYHILYGNSPRYTLTAGAKAWICEADFKPSDAAPELREEVFPELWDAQPWALVELLSKSEAARVHEFAAKALEANPNYDAIIQQITTENILGFLQKPFPKTNTLGLSLAKARYNAAAPDAALALALLICPLTAANQLAEQWVTANPAFFFSKTDFLVAILLKGNKNRQTWLNEQFAPSYLTETAKTELIKTLFQHLTNETTEAFFPISYFLNNYFPKELTQIPLNWISALLKIPSSSHQVFAGELLINHTTPIEALPSELIQMLLEAEEAAVRAIGLQLLAKFSDKTLLQKQDTLTASCISPAAEVRQAVRPIIRRLAAEEVAFAEKLVHDFVRFLLRKEPYEGLHKDLMVLLKTDLTKHLHIVERKMMFRLLNSKYENAQILAAHLVKNHIPANTLSVRNIIRLADHEMKEVRQTAWHMFTENLGRMRYEREEAIRLLDAKWDDSRAFAFEFFKTQFKTGDWTPELLVGVCDSVRTDVQAFGRELIKEFFNEEQGATYLLQLSEHPATKMQNFAAKYLQEYAAGDLEMLQRLAFYCKVVLLKVNQGRTAKNLVFSFLHQEAMLSEAAAIIVIRILKRVSLTVAIADKARCIEILRDIHFKYPALDNPLKVAV